MSVVYIFAAELFPTEVRNIGIGFGSMVGRIGSVVAPFIILLQDFEGLSFLPYVIFGICGIISGLWALWLPDTTGKPILQEIFNGIWLTDPSEDSKLVHRRICTKVDTFIFFFFFSDASERRVWLSAESKILASTLVQIRLYRFK